MVDYEVMYRRIVSRLAQIADLDGLEQDSQRLVEYDLVARAHEKTVAGWPDDRRVEEEV